MQVQILEEKIKLKSFNLVLLKYNFSNLSEFLKYLEFIKDCNISLEDNICLMFLFPDSSVTVNSYFNNDVSNSFPMSDSGLGFYRQLIDYIPILEFIEFPYICYETLDELCLSRIRDTNIHITFMRESETTFIQYKKKLNKLLSTFIFEGDFKTDKEIESIAIAKQISKMNPAVRNRNDSFREIYLHSSNLNLEKMSRLLATIDVKFKFKDSIAEMKEFNISIIKTVKLIVINFGWVGMHASFPMSNHYIVVFEKVNSERNSRQFTQRFFTVFDHRHPHIQTAGEFCTGAIADSFNMNLSRNENLANLVMLCIGYLTNYNPFDYLHDGRRYFPSANDLYNSVLANSGMIDCYLCKQKHYISESFTTFYSRINDIDYSTYRIPFIKLKTKLDIFKFKVKGNLNHNIRNNCIVHLEQKRNSRYYHNCPLCALDFKNFYYVFEIGNFSCKHCSTSISTYENYNFNSHCDLCYLAQVKKILDNTDKVKFANGYNYDPKKDTIECIICNRPVNTLLGTKVMNNRCFNCYFKEQKTSTCSNCNEPQDYEFFAERKRLCAKCIISQTSMCDCECECETVISSGDNSYCDDCRVCSNCEDRYTSNYYDGMHLCSICYGDY